MLALNGEGEKEVLGLWIEQTEGAKFWLKVMSELKARGVNDVLIAVVALGQRSPWIGLMSSARRRP